MPENDPTRLGDELVVRRVTEHGYIFDDNIGCTRPTGSAYLQDGRDGQTSVPRLSRTTPAEVHALGQEPYLAVLEVQTLRHEVLGIIFDPKPGESDHCNITGHKGENLLRRIARKAWWEEGFAPPLKGLPCSTPGKSHTNGSLRRVPAWGSLLTKEQPDLPAAEFSIQRGGRLPMVPGRPRQGGSLGRPGNVFLGAVTEGPARRTGCHEAGIAPVRRCQRRA